MCALLKNNDVDGVRVHCSPDPIWFPRSSPPAPSAASSRSCGWGPRRGVLTWAAEEAHRAEAGVEVGAAVPWRSRNALFRHFNQEVCAQCAHRCSRVKFSDRELFIQTPVFDSSQTSRGIRGTHKLLILSISRSRLNERPIRLGLERCDHTQFLSRRWRLIEIYLIFLPCLS